MRIGIDVSQIVYQGSGVARYTHTLVESLLKYDNKNEYVLFFSSLRQSFPEQLETLAKKHQIVSYIMPPTFLDTMWNRVHRVSVEKFTGSIDVFFSSDWAEPPSRVAKKVTTIHDLTIFRYPETYRESTKINLPDFTVSPNIVETQKRRLHWVKKESSRILCDSNATKRDVMELLKIEENRLRTVYPAVTISAPSKEVVQAAKTKYNLQRPFVLTVGKIEPRKNIPKLISAFEKMEGSNDVELLVVGPQGWETSKIHENVSPRVRFLGYVSDEELAALYTLAECFVFPSLYEGFGYPVVEAMSLGCPVATSNTSSMSEVGKESALLFNPTSVDEIAQALQDLLSKEKLRKDLAAKGKKHATEFSSKKFAESVIEVFEELV